MFQLKPTLFQLTPKTVSADHEFGAAGTATSAEFWTNRPSWDYTAPTPQPTQPSWSQVGRHTVVLVDIVK